MPSHSLLSKYIRRLIPEYRGGNRMDTSSGADEQFLLAGAWYHELLRCPPTAYAQSITPWPAKASTSDSTENSEPDDCSSSTESEEPLLDLPPLNIHSNPALTSFHLFPELPIDLRLEIWRHCHPPPRNVILSIPHYLGPRNRAPDWYQRRVPPHPPSQFVTLLVNYESRSLFLTHYELIFTDFLSSEKPKKDGKNTGWYFDPRKDSLCFGDGVQGLRWFIGRFPDEKIWERVRYIDVDVDSSRYNTHRKTEPPLGYFDGVPKSALVLGKMRKLTLVSIRVVVVRFQQWRHRKNGYWRPWENSALILKEWLIGRREENAVTLAMQYIWTDGGAVASFVNSKPGHEDFLAKFPVATSADVARRWMEIGIFLQDGANKIHPVYDTEKEIFCRNLLV
jgi:2EXR family